MILEEYYKIEKKEEFFINGGSKINNNIEKIFEEISKFKTKGDSFIFRGCSEAKYRLYNSAQRLYINQELHKQVPPGQISEHYKNFIVELIESCKSWNNRVIERHLENAGINKGNSLAYLSYMQHYGVPTPFLDYSYNPYVALFFAIDNLKYKASEIEIENYFSFYYTYSNATVFDSWNYVFKRNVSNQKNITYDDIDLNDMSIILPEDNLYQILNSINIINQEGLFFYNNHPWYPLEKTYKEFVEKYIEKNGKEKFDELLMHDTISGCFNIHKSLIPAIEQKLNSLGINRNFIYPDMNDFMNKVTNDGILNSLTLKR